MKRIKKIGYFLIILSVLAFSGSNAYAQNVFKLDFIKTSQKFSIWVQKQAENFENAIKEISESQFATFIGKGIDAAKKAITFVQDKVKEAKDLYANLKKMKDDVVDSKAYQVATLSKELSSETSKLNDMKQQRDKEKATIKSNAEIEIMTLEEKIKIAQENFDTGVAVFENEINELTTEEEKELKRKELEEYKKTNSDAIKAIEEEIISIEENVAEEIKTIDDTFDASIADQTSVISNIGIEISELTKMKQREEGKMEKDPSKVIENAIGDFSFKEGELMTLEARAKKEKTRNKKRESISTTSSSLSADIVSKTEEKIEDGEQEASSSKTVEGKSEALQTAISQTAVQLDTLYKFLLLELKALELETANIMSENKEYVAGKSEVATNICNYEMNKKSSLDGLSGLADFAKGVADVGTTAAGVVKDIKATTEDKNINKDIVTGLTGM